MDLIKPKLKPTLFSNQQLAVMIVIAFIVLLSVYLKQSLNTLSVKRSEIIISQVKQGDLNVIIDGYGELKSAKLQLLTSLSRATVSQILLKPGASVTANSVILILENPELVQQLDNANQKLEQVKANLRQLKLHQKRESLNESASIAEIVAKYETAKLKRHAEEKLVKDGIIAKNTYEESQLNEKQLKQRIAILKNREKQLVDVHYEAINIQKEIIKQHRGRIKLAQQRVDKLQVRAGLDGVLQSLSVELGQSLAAGQTIALIGSVKKLIALIKVPQSQAELLMLKQKVIIDTRRDKINGRIVRIDPVVENNTVTIEIALPDNLPSSARPHGNVDAIIIADTLKNILYIDRPANIQANSDKAIFKISQDSQVALLTKLKFGRLAGRYVEIIEKANLGDTFIVSDLSHLQAMTKQLVLE